MTTHEDMAHVLVRGDRGGFAAAIGEAFLVADSANREILAASFPKLFEPQSTDQALAAGYKAIADRLCLEVRSHIATLHGVVTQLDSFGPLVANNALRARGIAEVRDRISNSARILANATSRAEGML